MTGSGYYALSLHFGIGIREDIESTIGRYDIVEANKPAFLRKNTSRSLRILNRWRCPNIRRSEETTSRDSGPSKIRS
jgi:ribosomal protein L32E